MIKKGKWFAPAFQQGVLTQGNRWITIDHFLSVFHVAKSYVGQNSDLPVFLFADQSSFTKTDLRELEDNPLPIAIFFFREKGDPSWIVDHNPSFEFIQLTEETFSTDVLEFETFPVLIDVEFTHDFEPYPKGLTPFEFMDPFEHVAKYDMIIPPIE